MKQTAVEWLIKEFNLENYTATCQFALEKERRQMATNCKQLISDEEFDALLKQVIEVQNLAMYSDISEDYRQGYLDGIKWLYSKLKQK